MTTVQVAGLDLRKRRAGGPERYIPRDGSPCGVPTTLTNRRWRQDTFVCLRQSLAAINWTGFARNALTLAGKSCVLLSIPNIHNGKRLFVKAARGRAIRDILHATQSTTR